MSTVQADYEQAKNHLHQFEKVLAPQFIQHLHQVHKEMYPNAGVPQVRSRIVQIHGARSKGDEGAWLCIFEFNSHKGGLFSSPWKTILEVGLYHRRNKGPQVWELEYDIPGNPKKDIGQSFNQIVSRVMHKEHFIDKMAAHFGIKVEVREDGSHGQLIRHLKKAA